MAHDVRDAIVDFVRTWSERTGIPQQRFVAWLGLAKSKFHDWLKRFGRVNEHNAWVPRDHWLDDDEKQAIVKFHAQYPLEGYRRLTFMMLDGDVAAVSPASVYRVLKDAGLLGNRPVVPSQKGTGFVQPLAAHEHWHVDVSYLNLGGTFYYLCSVLDGYSRSLVHWEIRESMKEPVIEVIVQRARECYPAARPRLISDNGPQFVAKEFKEFVRLCAMTHVRTAPYYPQSNGKIERWHQTLKGECIRPGTPLTREDAERIVGKYVTYYNEQRLHGALGYLTPKDKLEGRAAKIFAARDRKLAEARERRRAKRQAQRTAAASPATTTAT